MEYHGISVNFSAKTKMMVMMMSEGEKQHVEN